MTNEQPGFDMGADLMKDLTRELKTVSAEIAALTGEPATVLPARLELLDRALLAVNVTEESAVFMMGGAELPGELTEMFAELRRQNEDAQDKVREELSRL